MGEWVCSDECSGNMHSHTSFIASCAATQSLLIPSVVLWMKYAHLRPERRGWGEEGGEREREKRRESEREREREISDSTRRHTCFAGLVCPSIVLLEKTAG